MYGLFHFFFFNDTATTEIYTLSLHDALPISELNAWERAGADASSAGMVDAGFENKKEQRKHQHQRSEERFSRNAETDLVCRLLLEKKNTIQEKLSLERCLLNDINPLGPVLAS